MEEDAVCVAIVGERRVLFPKAELALQADDRVIVLTTIEREQAVARTLG